MSERQTYIVVIRDRATNPQRVIVEATDIVHAKARARSAMIRSGASSDPQPFAAELLGDRAVVVARGLPGCATRLGNDAELVELRGS